MSDNFVPVLRLSLGHMVGLNTDAGEEHGVVGGQEYGGGARCHRGRNRHNLRNADSRGAGEDLIQVAAEVFVVQMRVRVDPGG
jgi:hypothetical protein